MGMSMSSSAINRRKHETTMTNFGTVQYWLRPFSTSFTGTSCSACETGYYGAKCAHACQEHCVDGTCTKHGCTRGCRYGYYKDLVDNTCKKCQPACKTCSNSDTCDYCDGDTYGSNCVNLCKDICSDGTCDLNTGKCETRCPKGDYYYWSICQSCHKCPCSCDACTSWTHCTTCKEGFVKVSNQCCHPNCVDCQPNHRCRACSEGFYLESNQCHQCQSPCDTCTTANQCKTCSKGYFLDLQQCRQCPSSCEACASSNDCSDCTSGYYLESQQCKQCSAICEDCTSLHNCTACKSGFHLESQQCKQCPSSFATCASLDSCSTCKPGYHLMSQQCHQCPTTCSTCTSSDQCLTCKQRYHLVSGECVECSPECKNQLCETGGHCTNGCTSSDRYGAKCDRSCRDTFQNCEACNTMADPVYCVLCKSGYVNALDSSQCIVPCSVDCKDRRCDLEGNCKSECSNGKWGTTCSNTCSEGCLNGICHKESGRCSWCELDKYGAQCDQACSKACVHPGNSSNVCRQSDGVCVFGCSPGKESQECSGSRDSHTGVGSCPDNSGGKTDVVTWVLAGVAAISIIFNITATIFIVKMRKQHTADRRQRPAYTGGNNAPSYVNMSHLDTTGQGQRMEYQFGTRQTQPMSSNNPNINRYLTPIPSGDEQGFRTAHTGLETSDNTYMSAVPGGDEHVFRTAHTGPEGSDNTYMSLTPTID